MGKKISEMLVFNLFSSLFSIKQSYCSYDLSIAIGDARDKRIQLEPLFADG